MNKQHFTIGLAGHIDHGKTELVKALTNVDTDRLKEEKERNISIELGYAPLLNEEHLSVSIIDVPGHEKFIRQMIAGVSSIDLTLLVIAANEGIMPQTLEHMEVLKHLGLHNVIIVITKIDQADQDLKSIVIEDLKDEMNGTVFENSPVFEVDSISKIGVEELKQSILNVLGKIVAKQTNGDLFLPVDQSFHLHGIGTIARGTVSQGSIRDGQTVYLMPHNIKAQVKGVHHFNEPVNKAVAGQRAAVALSHINISDVNRGVVITDHPGKSTNRVDIELDISKLLDTSIKQRAPIKLHTGTSELFGRLIFFDRNKLEPTEGTIYAQLELDQSIFILKDQRFILRRATPEVIIGGGRIIEPYAVKHRHNQETIKSLKRKASFSPEDYLLDLINRNPGMTFKQLGETAEEHVVKLVNKGEIIKVEQSLYSKQFMNNLKDEVISLLESYHNQHPLLVGINKSELISRVSNLPKDDKNLIGYLVESGYIQQKDYYIYRTGFTIKLSSNQVEFLNDLLSELSKDRLNVKPINSYLKGVDGSHYDDWILYLTQQGYIVQLTDELYVEKQVFEDSIMLLKEQTGNQFEVKEAKEILGLSRKYMIPFLEKLDKLNYTIRQENQRKWLSN